MAGHCATDGKAHTMTISELKMRIYTLPVLENLGTNIAVHIVDVVGLGVIAEWELRIAVVTVVTTNWKTLSIFMTASKSSFEGVEIHPGRRRSVCLGFDLWWWWVWQSFGNNTFAKLGTIYMPSLYVNVASDREIFREDLAAFPSCNLQLDPLFVIFKTIAA